MYKRENSHITPWISFSLLFSLFSFVMTSISWMLDNLNVFLLFLLLLFSFLFPCLFILSYGRFPQLYLSNKVSTLTFLLLKALSCFLDVPLYSSLFSFCGCIKKMLNGHSGITLLWQCHYLIHFCVYNT